MLLRVLFKGAETLMESSDNMKYLLMHTLCNDNTSAMHCKTCVESLKNVLKYS